VSWAFSKKVESAEGLARYLARQSRTLQEIASRHLTCRYLTGVHPRNIPPDLRPGDVAAMLLPHLDDDLCLGIGEIGLETASPREVDVLRAQLDLAGEVTGRGMVIGVHTPRRDKERVAGRILEVLEPYVTRADRIVVDHCTPAILGGVLAMGFRAGVTVSPIKSSFEDVTRMIEDHPEALDRIMLNTDSGSQYHDDLLRIAESRDLPERIRMALVRDNALRFYGLTGHRQQ
jgi:predicted metal-dependent TIM-barrel fold hydrolase